MRFSAVIFSKSRIWYFYSVIMFLVIEKEEERTPCTCWKMKRSTANNHARTKTRTRTHGAEHVRHATTTPPKTEERRSTNTEKTQKKHGAELTRSTGGALKGGRRAVLNATAEIVGTWYKCDLRFCAEIFQSIKCDFQKCVEILKNIFKKSHLI